MGTAVKGRGAKELEGGWQRRMMVLVKSWGRAVGRRLGCGRAP